MRIVADRNIPTIKDACNHLGEVRLFSSSDPESLASMLVDADVLLCRSTMQVNKSLLEFSPVRFVATATSGIEHLDTSYLQARSIAYASAVGSNAISVAEYMFAALFHLAAIQGFSLASKSLGIIGCGQVGKAVARIAEALGMRVLRNDPPLFEETGDACFLPLGEVLTADIVTCHTPFTCEGKYPTADLIGASAFAQMKDGVIFVNTSRGGVVVETDLKRWSARGKFSSVILDVFRNEPHIDTSLLDIATLATAHIAGHSFDGKLRGTRMVYEALCAFLRETPQWEPPPVQSLATIEMPVFDTNSEAIISKLISCVYDIQTDDVNLRQMQSLPEDERSRYFSALRNEYRMRREFSNFVVHGGETASSIKKIVRTLGFRPS